MLYYRNILFKLAVVALLIALASPAAQAEWKSRYLSAGNNIGMAIDTDQSGGPWGGRFNSFPTQFPRGSGNFWSPGRTGWGANTARDCDGDGVPEDTTTNRSRAGDWYGQRMSFEYYDEITAAGQAGENMGDWSGQLANNRVWVSTDADDLADWPAEFREGRSASGSPILHGAESVCCFFGDVFDDEGNAVGLSVEYRMHFLNFGESNDIMYYHVFFQNMSEYAQYNGSSDHKDKIAGTLTTGQTWQGMQLNHNSANGTAIGDRNEGWAIHSKLGAIAIIDRDGVESSFSGDVWMVILHWFELPTLRDEQLKWTNHMAHGWSNEFGIAYPNEVLEGGHHQPTGYRYGNGRYDAMMPVPPFYADETSPWTGGPLYGWPGVFIEGEAAYDTWVWGYWQGNNQYTFFSEFHNVAPRDSFSCDAMIAFVYPANPPFVLPANELANLFSPTVQEQMVPAENYMEAAAIVRGGGYILPETPAPPALTIIPGNEVVTITWSDINLHTPDAYYGFLQDNPSLDPNGVYREYDFEGYRLYRSFVGPSDSHSELLMDCSLSAGNLVFYYKDFQSDDTPYYRMNNGMKVWYALVPYDSNVDPASGASFSLPDLASGKMWNRPGTGLYTVEPRSDASNFKVATQSGEVTYVGGATNSALMVDIPGDGAGKLTGNPVWLEPPLEFEFEPINNERITSDVTTYVACTGVDVRWSCPHWAFPQRVMSMVDGSGNIVSSASPFETLNATKEIVLMDAPASSGVSYAVHVFWDHPSASASQGYAPTHIEFDTGSYTGASVENKLYWGCDDSRIGSNPSIGAYIRNAKYELTWKASGGGLSLDVVDLTHGVTVPFSPYRDELGAWGFMPAGSYDETAGDFFEEIKAGVPRSERTLLMLETVPADNTENFAITVNGIVWELSDITAMPTAGTKFTIVNAFGTWNADQTVFTQIADAPYPGDKWQINIKAMSMEPEDADLSKVRVVPNPYIASSFLDLSPDSRRIEFVNLPDQCTIRIYSLGGHLVNVLNHIGANRHGWGDYLDWDRLNAQGQPREFTGYDNHGGTEPWNLRNRFGQTVASGLYFFHVTDSRGETYTGKFYVVN